MIQIMTKQTCPLGEVWISKFDLQIFLKSAYLEQELGKGHRNRLQSKSGIDLQTLPLFACKIPSYQFFPFVTYHCGTWFTKGPNIIIPKNPVNRLSGKNWLRNLATTPMDLLNNDISESACWFMGMGSDGKVLPDSIISQTELQSLSLAAQTYFLDDIRYAYADNNRDKIFKTSIPSRSSFSENIVSFNNTRIYLDWYITIFNQFLDKLLNFDDQSDDRKYTQSLTSVWTINRLAIDALSILAMDTSYVRKWQFFGFLDALGNLINQFSTEKSSVGQDKEKFCELLEMSYFTDLIRPILEMIPVPDIREELISYTQSIYKSIEGMEVKLTTNGDERVVSGPKLLRAYRNSRHGFSINETDKSALIAHDGNIPDNIPDLCIALWHYVLLGFPFISS